jgi:hypothetical protein
MAEAGQIDGVIGDLHPDKTAIQRQTEIAGPGKGIERSCPCARLVSLCASDSLRRGAMEKKKPAPKAWAIRTRLPRFIGLEMPSTPTPK